MKRRHFRHLPPTAVRVSTADLQAGLRHSDSVLNQFQDALAAYLDIDQAACKLASSGRTALFYLLRGLKAESASRSQVVMPAYTCPAVARVVIDLDLKPVFVDISTETMGFATGQLAPSLNEETLAVILVHPFGISLPAANIIALAHDAGAVVIEDAAQALGAKWDGDSVGTKGDYGLFSLGPGKPISTAGGGIVITKEHKNIPSLNSWWADLPEVSASVSAAAWMRQAAFQLAFHPKGWWAATRVGLHRVGNHESSWGYTLRGLAPSQAGVGLALLPRLDAINTQRRRRAATLQEAASHSASLQCFSISEEAGAIFLRFPILAESEQQREALFNRFWSAGIGAGRLYEKSLPAIFSTSEQAPHPGAEAIASRLLTLPTHHYVTEDDLEAMGEILRGFR